MAKIPHPNTSFAPILADLDRRVKALEMAAFQSLTLVGGLFAVSGSTNQVSPYATIASTTFTLTRPGNVLVLGVLQMQNSLTTDLNVYARLNLDGQLSNALVFCDVGISGGAKTGTGIYMGTTFLIAVGLGVGTHTLSVEGAVQVSSDTLTIHDGTVQALLIGP